MIFGRPCTLVGDPNKGAAGGINAAPIATELAPSCTNCGSGPAADPAKGGGCTFKVKFRPFNTSWPEKYIPNIYLRFFTQ